MIEFTSVTKTYRNSWNALTGINLRIEKGEFIFILGATGAGKTTLLRLIYRDELPTVGRISVLGFNLMKISMKEVPNLRRQIGVVFQDFKLLQERTAYDNLDFVLRVIKSPTQKTDIPKKIEATMKRLGIFHKKDLYPYELSGGEQQKISIARALVKDPEILLADEPTGNIDPKGAEEIFQILKEINYQGTTVIVATHNLELANRFKKRTILLESGRIVNDS